MPLKTTSSLETYFFAGLISIMLHFSKLISSAVGLFCESFEAGVRRSEYESSGFAPKPIV